MRAFMNGKMDLTQGGGGDGFDLCSDRSCDARCTRTAAGALWEMNRKRYVRRSSVIAAHIEAYIDFSRGRYRYRIPEQLYSGAWVLWPRVLVGYCKLRSRGGLLREGVRTVIFGAPNAGKSSLLNKLLDMNALLSVILRARPATHRRGGGQFAGHSGALDRYCGYA